MEWTGIKAVIDKRNISCSCSMQRGRLGTFVICTGFYFSILRNDYGIVLVLLLLSQPFRVTLADADSLCNCLY